LIKINLLAEGKRPAAVRKSREPATSFLQSENAAAWLLLAALLLLGLLPTGIWWWLKSSEIHENEVKIAEAQREVDELAAIIREVEEYKAKQAELERKIEVINQLRRNQKGPVHVMDSISRALPELLWLDKLDMNANSIKLEGRAFNANAVATFVENLDKVPEFQEPILQDLNQDRGGTFYSFAVQFNYSFATLADDAGATATNAAGG